MVHETDRQFDFEEWKKDVGITNQRDESENREV
jgi:hypothetical protein